VLIGLGSGMALLPQGYDGGSKMTTTTSTETNLAMHFRSKPLSSAEAAKYLNELFLGFDDANKSSPLGVTISMAAQPRNFFGNMFCSRFFNTSCFNGHADCRLSASLYSHAWSYDPVTKQTLMGLSRSVGFAFNQSMVESRWAKCSYIWDGATANKLNRGCGAGRPASCDPESRSAYFNICSTGKICTANDDEVKRAACKDYGGVHPAPPTHNGHNQCFFPGPALDYHLQENFNPGEDKMRDMAAYRIKYNDGYDFEGPNVKKWNEVVLDETLLLPDMWYDPASALVAFLYTKSQRPISLKQAKAMRDYFCEFYKVQNIPLVEIDDLANKDTGPFHETTSDAATMVI